MTRGVSFNNATQKWRASLRGFGRNGYIGEFETLDAADAARVAAEIQIHGAAHDAPVIRVLGDTADVPLMGARGRVVAVAKVDASDVPLIHEGRWSLTRSGYAVQRRAGRYVYMHRLFVPEGTDGDHIDGDTLNNRRANLRSCTHAENSRNRKRLSRNNSSGAKGVSRANGGGKPWRARITVDRREINLGRFDTKEAAAAAYAVAALKHHGSFASPVMVEALADGINAKEAA